MSAHVSGIANNVVSFSGIVTNLNNNESSNIYLSPSTSMLHIALLELGNLFCAKYKYMSLKYGLSRYSACISFMVTGRWVPFNTFLCIIFKILSTSVCFGKYFWTILLVLIKSASSGGSSNWDLSGLWYISDIMPSWYEEFSSKSLISKSKSKFIFLSSYIFTSSSLGGGFIRGSG